MHAIGASALRRAWVVALYIVSLAFLRMRLGRQEMDRSAERGIYAVLGLVSTALLALLYALLTDDFHLRYVATVSHRAMSTFYVITGLWGGQENLMLLWLWLLALYSTLDLLQRLLQAPRDGRDLNPLLQHPLMVLHPPMLSLGTEWRTSRYADHPGNPSCDPKFKRDCQTCHMQQDYGHPGTAQTLYTGTGPQAPLTGKVWPAGADRPVFYSHHCIGGNSYIPRRPGVVNANGLPINTHARWLNRTTRWANLSIPTAMATCSMRSTTSTRASSRCRTRAPPCTSTAMPSSSPPAPGARWP